MYIGSKRATPYHTFYHAQKTNLAAMPSHCLRCMRTAAGCAITFAGSVVTTLLFFFFIVGMNETQATVFFVFLFVLFLNVVWFFLFLFLFFERHVHTNTRHTT